MALTGFTELYVEFQLALVEFTDVYTEFQLGILRLPAAIVPTERLVPFIFIPVIFAAYILLVLIPMPPIAHSATLLHLNKPAYALSAAFALKAPLITKSPLNGSDGDAIESCPLSASTELYV